MTIVGFYQAPGKVAGLSGVCQETGSHSVKRRSFFRRMLAFMVKIERSISEQAFDFGYHSEKLPGAAHTIHNLKKDAEAMCGFLSIDPAVDAKAVWNAMIFGAEYCRYDDADRVLQQFADIGDTTLIWTLGDPVSQVFKIRSLGWDSALKNPLDPGNFKVYAAEDKLPILPWLSEYAGRRNCQTIYVVDDKLKNIQSARRILGDRANYVWIHRADEIAPEDIDGIFVVHSLTEYQQLVQEKRNEGEEVAHILDLDGTLIDPDSTYTSRKDVVVETISEGKIYERLKRSKMRPFNGFYILDTDGHFLKMTGGEVTSPDFSGHQAHIYRSNGSLVKAFAWEDAHRPETKDWQELGGYRGAKNLIKTLRNYRNLLKKTGLPVPPDADFLLARDKKGKFLVVEVVSDLGKSVQEEFFTGALEARQAITKKILETAFPVFLANGLGIDAKPANFVVDGRGQYIHIDPLPHIMVEDDGTVWTEWPRIEAQGIQKFLYETHLTPLAIGYRLYQELCQVDPAHRSAYQQSMTDVLLQKVQTGHLTGEQFDAIRDAIEPLSSRIIVDILKGKQTVEKGFLDIHEFLATDVIHRVHPIYAIREMSFAVSEYIADNDALQQKLCQQALRIVFSRLGKERCEKIQTSLRGVPENIHYLTILRKLTHLSATDWVAGADEETALYILEETVREVDNEH